VSIEIIPVKGIGEVEEDAGIAKMIYDRVDLKKHDIVVITSKILAKAYGYTTSKRIHVTDKERKLAKKLHTDPVRLAIMRWQRQQILAVVPMLDFVKGAASDSPWVNDQLRNELCANPVCITRTESGRIATSDGGIDESNHQPGVYSYVPDKRIEEDAQILAMTFRANVKKDIAVIISDTELFPQGGGTMDLAVGSYGISPVANNFGKIDRNGRPKFGGTDSTVHILAGMAGLVMGQADESIPAVVIRGVDYKWDSEKTVRSSAPKFSRKTLKSVLRLTAETKPLLPRLVLKGIACLM
jgi:coenzyme F420-0:L-glutamate ligase/coenzyme F420-1:gamma-L-glutamate ligase